MCIVDRPMKGSMLPTGRHVLLALLMSAFAAHAAAQGSGLLLAGQSLPQVSVHDGHASAHMI